MKTDAVMKSTHTRQYIRTTALFCALAASAVVVPGEREAPARGDLSTPAKRDPKLAAVLDAIKARYRSLRSLELNIKGTVSIKGDKAHSERPWNLHLAFSNPNRAIVTIVDWHGKRVCCCDGKNLYVSSSADQRHYVTMPLMPGQTGARQALLEVGAGDSAYLLTGCDMFSIARFSRLTGCSLGKRAYMDGTEVDQVFASYSGPFGTDHFVASIGATDHLLHRWTETQALPGNHVMTTELTFSNMRCNLKLADSLFVFRPPQGASAIAKKAQTLYDTRLVRDSLPAPLAGRDLQGRPIKLEEYRGRVLLVDYWATWCGPCIQEIPDLAAAYKKYHAAGLDIISISLDTGSQQTQLARYTRDHEMSWRQACEGHGFDSALVRTYKITGIPFTLLIGRNGKVAAVNLHGDQLESAIRTAIAAN